MTVPCRNRRLFRRVFRSYHCLRSAVSLSFREGWGSYVLRIFIRYSCICKACMSPAVNRSSAIQRFKHSNAIEIHDGITFDFYTGLSHIYYLMSEKAIWLDIALLCCIFTHHIQPYCLLTHQIINLLCTTLI